MSETGSADRSAPQAEVVPVAAGRRWPHPGAVLLLIAGGLLIGGAFFDLCTISTPPEGPTVIRATAWSLSFDRFSVPRYFGGPLVAVGVAVIVVASGLVFGSRLPARMARMAGRAAVLMGGVVVVAVVFMVAHVCGEIALATEGSKARSSIGAGMEMLLGAGLVAIVALVALFRTQPAPQPRDRALVDEPDVVIYQLPSDTPPHESPLQD